MVKRRTINNPYQVSMLVDAVATYYPDMVQVYIPKMPIVRLPSGFDGKTYSGMASDIDTISNENNEERSIRRSAKTIGDYILCNDFDMFVTFTIKDDRQNIERSRQKVINWLKNQRNRNGKFRYIVVPEFHKDGESLHFHALIGDFTGKIEQAINPKTSQPLKQKGRNVYQIVGYTLGFTNVKLIGKEAKDRSKLSAYLKKYITKDMPSFPGKQRYWVSKGLKQPTIEDNPEKWYEHVKPDWSREFDNGTLMRFNVGKNALLDIFWEANR